MGDGKYPEEYRVSYKVKLLKPQKHTSSRLQSDFHLPADTMIHTLTPYAVREDSAAAARREAKRRQIQQKRFENATLPALITRNASEPGFKQYHNARSVHMPPR